MLNVLVKHRSTKEYCQRIAGVFVLYTSWEINACLPNRIVDLNIDFPNLSENCYPFLGQRFLSQKNSLTWKWN